MSDHHEPSRACYVAGCDRDECRAANTLYENRRRMRRTPALVDAAVAREVILTLNARGIGLPTIAELSGLAYTTVWEIRAGERRQVTHRTLDRLRNVRMAEVPDGVSVPAGPVKRLLEALRRAGYSSADLARLLGSSAARPKLEYGDQVTAGTARRVAELYQRLWKTNPAVRQVRP